MATNKESNMPKEKEQQTECSDKYVDIRFQHLEKIVDRMERSFEKTVNEIRTEVKEIKADNEKTKVEVKADNEKMKVEIKAEIAEIKTDVYEIKRDNKATRWWVIGTGVAVVFGIATIFLTFAQIQTSWMQQVITFSLKAIR